MRAAQTFVSLSLMSACPDNFDAAPDKCCLVVSTAGSYQPVLANDPPAANSHPINSEQSTSIHMTSMHNDDRWTQEGDFTRQQTSCRLFLFFWNRHQVWHKSYLLLSRHG